MVEGTSMKIDGAITSSHPNVNQPPGMSIGEQTKQHPPDVSKTTTMAIDVDVVTASDHPPIAIDDASMQESDLGLT